ncbi:acyltransferase family protein [Saccharospirillum impatiens]|uniref:acyltransferase family protein n=1 Tax=Saccharospirillum impatiens TaxID=169438 RepID=UPI00041C3465|nr:acyltransferase family protein [Saccharospirillum impatiens]
MTEPIDASLRSALSSYRALALFIAVASLACFDVLNWSGHRTTERWLLNLFNNAPVFFVFLSGLLLTLKRTELSSLESYGRFLARHACFIGVPYLVWLLPGLAYEYFPNGEPSANYPHLLEWPLWLQLGWYVVTGGTTANYPLWFIPMLALIYLSLPVWLALARRPALLIGVFVVSVIWANTLQRPLYPNREVWWLWMYFWPALLLGMLAALWLERGQPCRRSLLVGCAVLAVSSLLWMTLVERHAGVYRVSEWLGPERALIDLLLINKLSLAVLLLLVCLSLSAPLHRLLRPWAAESYGIFLAHTYGTLAVAIAIDHALITGHLGTWLIRVALSLFVFYGAMVLTRRVFSHRADWLIGRKREWS